MSVTSKVNAVSKIETIGDGISVKEVLQSFVDDRVFSAAAWAVGNSGETLEEGALGHLSWGGTPTPPDALFDLASVTKPIVALAVMKLLEEGKLCLDDPIASFLPDWRGSDKENISLLHLLTHTSGIPGQVPLYRLHDTREKLLEAVKALPLRNPVGRWVEYSSQGFMIVGRIVEAVAGMPLDRVLEEKLFAPLGMKNTFFNPPPSERGRAAATENCPWRGRIVQGEVHDENAAVLGGVCGHAGLFGTAGDLATLCRALLDNRLLHPATRASMTRNRTADLNLARALGWQKKDPEASPAGDLFTDASFGHTGFTGTSLWMDPDLDCFAVLLTNRVHPSREGEGIQHVRRVFHNLAVLRGSLPCRCC